MKSVSIQELKQSLSAQIAAVEAGAAIVITRHGRAVARITAMNDARCRVGAKFGQYTIHPAIRGGVQGRALEILQEDRRERLDDIL